MPNFEKYNLSQVKTERFYQLPKYLFEDAYFKKMSAEAKIMYALLKDRFELSLQNEWVDKNNNIYFIFSNKHLCEYLGYAEQKIIKLKKELIKFNLLTQERVGLNKPNRLYLLKPNYDIKASHTKELPNSQFQNNEFGSSRTVNLSGQELPNSQSNDTDYNDTNYIKTNNNDTYDMNDKRLTYPNNHSDHSNHYHSKFNDEALKFQLLEELPQNIQNYLNNFSVDEIKLIKSVLLKAKTSFNNSIDTYYLLEDIEIEILHVLKRFKAVLIQKNETVEAMQGYLMKSLKSEFAEVHTLNKRRDNLPITSLFNT
ncbi:MULTISPECIES: replication initiator protein A [Bacillati]|uniref:replication initiator protein A n=1 Tax=Bacillati TaxID=1783272 RepID=UPI0004A8CFFC|nr:MULTISPECIES: replication initiator protein A [Staphylococcus]KDP67772.1 replication initiator protein A, N-terminal domain protein [Staphylococcus epidermidis VCU111]MBF2163219.1 replication initiator protein A [Staphylococcus epidermidis]MBM6057813.1 replication initiator protein A [Staphylococcus epidermidis]MBV2115605.1 replication initiator protein A [Staphylococcus epidermidis]MCG1806580.1 replication initiator protein A [Staphylococcus epidermidis]